MRKSKWLRLLAVVLTFTLLAAACGSSDDSDTAVTAESSDDSAAEQESEPEAAAEPAEADEPEPEPEEESQVEDLGNVEIDEEAASCATDVEVEVGEFDPSPGITNAMGFQLTGGFNPHNNQAPAAFSYYGWVYEGLVRQDGVTGAIVPWLAKCWESNEAGDQITFFMHEGVTFHDDAPLNAAAVVANVEFIKTAGPPEVLPPVAGQMGLVDSVVALDEYTVQFNLNSPGEALLLSGMIRNSGFLVSPNALGNAAANPVGTGPYWVESENEDHTDINLTAFENYWQPQLVGMESVNLLGGLDNQARLDGVVAGQFDIATINNNEQELVPAYSANTTVRIGFVVADWTGEKVPALANKDVRCAVAAALNRVGIQEAGGNDPASAIKQFAVTPSDYGYVSDLASPDFDLELAKSLMDGSGEAGFEFTNRHLPGGFWPVVSSALSGALAEIGITMNNEALDPPGAGEMFANLARGDSPIQIIAYNEPNALMSLIARTGEASFNPSKVSPDGVVDLVNSARSKSFEDGEADVAAAWKIMIEECIFIINHVLTTTVAHQTNITGLQHSQGIPVSFWPQDVRSDG